jgi:hypothetical protein
METDCDYCGDTPALMNKFKGLMKPQPKQHWGNHLWGFIHTISLASNPKSIEVLRYLTNVIPCEVCKEMYLDNLKLLDTVDLNKKLALFYWSVDLHNKVNTKLNKIQLTYSEASSLYF